MITASKPTRSLASIAHPNLIPLYELFVEGDDWFFTMEILEGATDLRSALRPRVKGPVAETTLARGELTAVRPRADTLDEVGLAITGRSPPTVPVDHARVRAAFRELATGVRALHAAGKLHRDLKPGNVMMRRDGRVVILDFGLVADLRSAPEPTDGPRSSEPRRYISTERNIAGTALYMAPEQAAALPLGEAADWYAVGVMLFEVLTGLGCVSGGSRVSCAATPGLRDELRREVRAHRRRGGVARSQARARRAGVRRGGPARRGRRSPPRARDRRSPTRRAPSRARPRRRSAPRRRRGRARTRCLDRLARIALPVGVAALLIKERLEKKRSG